MEEKKKTVFYLGFVAIDQTAPFSGGSVNKQKSFYGDKILLKSIQIIIYLWLNGYFSSYLSPCQVSREL